MIFSSRYTIDIPTIDLLSYLFGNLGVSSTLVAQTDLFAVEIPPPHPNVPLFIDPDNQAHNITKLELQTLVKKLGCGLQKVRNIKENDAVLMFTENSVSALFSLPLALVNPY